jgi:hypothetical protein
MIRPREGDGKGVQGFFPPVRPALPAHPGGIEAHDRQIDALEPRGLGREVSPGLDRLAYPGVHRLDRVRRVDHLADGGSEAQERHELRPRGLPQLDDRRILPLPRAGEVGKALEGGRLGRGGVDRLEVRGDRRPVPPRGVTETAENVINALPKSAQPAARRVIAEIRDAEDRDHALEAIRAFERDYGAKWPKAVAKIVDDTENLLSFFDFPAEHWIHLKTSNPIESTFATVRLRTKVTKGPGSKAAGLAMAFKLIETAQDRWRAVNAPHLVALVRAGAKFEKGVMVERPNKQDTKVAA